MPATKAPPLISLIGGPADAAKVYDEGRDCVYVALAADLTPLLDDAGQAMTLPDEPGPATEKLLNDAAQRWELYCRRDVLGVPVYVWVRS
jgi:hypothetical protein